MQGYDVNVESQRAYLPTSPPLQGCKLSHHHSAAVLDYNDKFCGRSKASLIKFLSDRVPLRTPKSMLPVLSASITETESIQGQSLQEEWKPSAMCEDCPAKDSEYADKSDCGGPCIFKAETSEELAHRDGDLSQRLNGLDKESGLAGNESPQPDQKTEVTKDVLASLAPEGNDTLPVIASSFMTIKEIVRRLPSQKSSRKPNLLLQERNLNEVEDEGINHSYGAELPHAPPSSPALQQHERERRFLCHELLQLQKKQSAANKTESSSGRKKADRSESRANLEYLDDMCGFKVGESVTTFSGPDEVGPWQKMGNGKVAGPGLQKGYLNVVFKPLDGPREPFEVKAKNLTRVSETLTGSQHESKMKAYGIRPGDPVIFNSHTRGVVMDAGPSPKTAMVRFRGLGTKEVCLTHLNKVTLDFGKYPICDDLKHVSKAERQRMKCLAAAQWAEVEVTDKEASIASGVVAQRGSSTLARGTYVRAMYDPWGELGIGIVEEVGSKLGSVMVRFNVQRDSWIFDCKDLKEVPRPGLCKFAIHKRVFDFERSLDAKCKS